MSAYWPTAGNDPSVSAEELEYQRIWLAKPKLVFSSTLTSVDWNARLVRGDAAEEVCRLKAEAGGFMSVSGAGLAGALMQAGLIDEYHLYIFPVILGGGKRMFPALSAPQALRQTKCAVFRAASPCCAGSGRSRNSAPVWLPQSLFHSAGGFGEDAYPYAQKGFDMKPAMGVIFHPRFAPEGLAAYARRAEAAGFDELWLWDDCFLPGAFTSAALALAATERIRVGIGLLPVPAYHPLFAAMELTTLARAYPGRILPGFGHGVRGWMEQMGVAPRSPLRALEETLQSVRALLHGERVVLDGEYLHLDGLQMETLAAAIPPLYVGGSAPRLWRWPAAGGRRHFNRQLTGALCGLGFGQVRAAAQAAGRPMPRRCSTGYQNQPGRRHLRGRRCAVPWPSACRWKRCSLSRWALPRRPPNWRSAAPAT
jgi:hypothetical protein